MKHFFTVLFIMTLGHAVGASSLMALTAAEKYAAEMSAAVDTRPGSFKIAGSDVAWVNPDGNLQLTTVPLTPAQAKDLRAWIKANFVDDVAP